MGMGLKVVGERATRCSTAAFSPIQQFDYPLSILPQLIS